MTCLQTYFDMSIVHHSESRLCCGQSLSQKSLNHLEIKNIKSVHCNTCIVIQLCRFHFFMQVLNPAILSLRKSQENKYFKLKYKGYCYMFNKNVAMSGNNVTQYTILYVKLQTVTCY